MKYRVDLKDIDGEVMTSSNQETLKDAKNKAKYMLVDRIAYEGENPTNYPVKKVEIISTSTNECVWDRFA